MKIIYVNKPFQDKNTIDPQIIEGKVVNWHVRSECLKESETFQEFLKRKEEALLYRKQDFEGIFVYDFQACATIDGKAGLIIRYQIFKKEIWE